ncbi:putative cytosine deaminase [Xylaria sp. FL0064]|nr:putative cytosine deaminase [Xylaria sp. FL0064]
MEDHEGLALALEEAQRGYEEGGVPIGAVLVAADGRLLGRGHNMRVQNGNPILHLKRHLLPKGTGACLLYGIPRVVIGENKTFLGGEAYLKQRGVEVVVLDSRECRELMERFIAEKPEVW